jgi:hypothetical protein
MTKEGVMKRADDYLDTGSNEALAVTYTDISGTQKEARTSDDYYRLASDYCQKLLALKDRPLNSDFGAVFKNECTFTRPVNDDVLYEVAFLASNGGDVGWCVGTTVNSSSKGATSIQVGLTPNYYFSFDDQDRRRDVTCARIYYQGDNDQYVSGITSLSEGKWNRLWLTIDPGHRPPKAPESTGP